MNKGTQSRLVEANEFQCPEPTLEKNTYCFHGSYLINTYLSKQAFLYDAFGQFLNLLGTFGKWNQPQTWIFHSFLFVFLCFDHFYPPSVLWLLKKIVLWPTPLFLILLEPQYPGTIKRMEKKKLLQKDQDLGTMWNSVGVFLNMFFTKTIKRKKINKATAIRKLPT